MKWLFPAEIAMVLYALYTILQILFTYTNIPNPEDLIWWRVRIVLLTMALWLVYRIWPCRLLAFARIVMIMVTLSWWYPDTYQLNRHFENLDHIFAQWDQDWFGCQPALIWAKNMPSVFISEMMAMGYFVYFFFFIALTIYAFLAKYHEFQRVTFVIIASFFIYYTIYDIFPVAGPQYYYQAVGFDKIAAGIFPEMGTYFSSHTEMVSLPGWDNGVFHSLVQSSHDAGERPTAAFPSSHVGVSTICMLIAIRLKEWRYLIIFAIPYIFLCMSTVYLMPHYAVDAIAGFISAIILFFALETLYVRVWKH